MLTWIQTIQPTEGDHVGSIVPQYSSPKGYLN